MEQYFRQEPETLRAMIAATVDVKEKVRLLKYLDVSLRVTDPTEALKVSHCAVRLAKSTSDQWLIASSVLQLGDCYRDQYKYRSALRYFNYVEKLIGNLPKDRLFRASLYRSFGLLYRNQGSHHEALDYFNRSLDIAREEKDGYMTAELLPCMSYIFSLLGDSAASIKILEESLLFFESTNDNDNCALVLNAMGDVCLGLNDSERALHYYSEACRLVIGTGHKIGEAVATSNMATAQLQLGNIDEFMRLNGIARETFEQLNMPLYIGYILYESGRSDMNMRDYVQALRHMSEALGLYKEANSPREIATCLSGIAEAHLHRNDLDKSLAILAEALPIAEQVGDKKLVGAIYELHSLAYERKGELKLALHYYKRSVQIDKEVQSYEAIQGVANWDMRIKIERAEKEREIYRLKSAQLEAEMEHKKKELIAMALHLTQKNEFVASLRRQIGAFGKSASHCKTELVKEIIPKINENLNADGEWDIFERQFHQVHPDFIAILSRHYPALSPTELKVCALMKTNLTTKQIASILCTSLRTVEGHRQYIRRKLGLSRTDNLYTHLASIGSIT